MKALIAAFALSLMIVAVGCGGDDDNVFNQPEVRNVSMTTDDTFSPVTVVVAPGDTVRWTNNDIDPHTVESDLDVAGLDSDTQYPNGLASGQTFNYRIPEGTAVGTRYYYHCRLHGAPGNGTSLGTGMAGVIEVGRQIGSSP